MFGLAVRNDVCEYWYVAVLPCRVMSLCHVMCLCSVLALCLAGEDDNLDPFAVEPCTKPYEAGTSPFAVSDQNASGSFSDNNPFGSPDFGLDTGSSPFAVESSFMPDMGNNNPFLSGVDTGSSPFDTGVNTGSSPFGKDDPFGPETGEATTTGFEQEPFVPEAADSTASPASAAAETATTTTTTTTTTTSVTVTDTATTPTPSSGEKADAKPEAALPAADVPPTVTGTPPILCRYAHK